MSQASNHVKKAQNALEGIKAGGKKNAAAAKEVNGNLTLAMNSLAGANSYVPFFLLCRLGRADLGFVLVRRAGKANNADQKKLNKAMQMMLSMMVAANATASSCAGA
jgi:hypothetical protein